MRSPRLLPNIAAGFILATVIAIPVAHAALMGGSGAGDPGFLNTLYCQLTGCSMTGQLVINPASGGSLSIRTSAVSASGSIASLGSAGSEHVGIYEGTAASTLNASGYAVGKSAAEFTGSGSGAALVTHGSTDITTGTNEDLTVSPNGTGTFDLTKHLKGANAQAAANSGSGTCTAVTVTGTDVRGKILATCTAGQTVIMNFGATFGAAPFCTLAPANAAADAVGSGSAFVASTTTQMTLTVPTAATAGIWNYTCVE